MLEPIGLQVMASADKFTPWACLQVTHVVAIAVEGLGAALLHNDGLVGLRRATRAMMIALSHDQNPHMCCQRESAQGAEGKSRRVICGVSDTSWCPEHGATMRGPQRLTTLCARRARSPM